MRAMLICAGFGTRLSPLTDFLPKPAVPVANQPLAWFALDHLHRAGVHELVVNTHHLAVALRTELSRVCPPDVRLHFVHEPQILGTGGGLKNAWRPIDGEAFIAMNGKLLFAPDIAAALRVHRESGAIATMVLKPMPEGASFSAVEIDDEGRVQKLLGEPHHPAGPLRHMMFTGVQILDARAHRDLPEQGCVIRDTYRHWLVRGERVMSVVDAASFRDAGISPWHYWEANQALLQGQERWPGIHPDPHQNVVAPEVVLPTDCRITQSVIGSGARIAPGLTIHRSIIWPNAKLTTDATDTIVLPNGTQVPIAAA